MALPSPHFEERVMAVSSAEGRYMHWVDEGGGIFGYVGIILYGPVQGRRTAS